MLNHVHDLSVLLVCECEHKASLCGINTNNPRPSFPIKAEQLVFDNTRCIERIVQGTNGTSITRRKTVLDMVKGSVNEEVGAGATRGADIPSSRLDSDSITDGTELFQLTVGNYYSIFAKKSNL